MPPLVHARRRPCTTQYQISHDACGVCAPGLSILRDGQNQTMDVEYELVDENDFSDLTAFSVAPIKKTLNKLWCGAQQTPPPAATYATDLLTPVV